MNTIILGKRLLFGVGMLTAFATLAFAGNRCDNTTPGFTKSENDFMLAGESFASPLVISNNDFDGVKLVAEWFCNDIELVCGCKPEMLGQDFQAQKQMVLVGTIGSSELIDKIIADGLLDVTEIEGQWERSLTEF
jgi:hypothetical protein